VPAQRLPLGLLDFAVEQARVGALPETRALPGGAHGTVLGEQIVDGNAETLRRALEEKDPGVRAGATQRRARVLDREATRGNPFVGAARGVGRDHANTLERDPQLLGGNLGERCQDTLPDLDLSAEDRHRAVALDPQPLGEPRILLQARGPPDPVGNRVHDRTCAAARITARTIRLCDPQRHRLRSSAARTSLALGLGFFARSAAALIRMPLVQ